MPFMNVDRRSPRHELISYLIDNSFVRRSNLTCRFPILNLNALHHHIRGTCYRRHTGSAHAGALFRFRIGVMPVSVTRTCTRRKMPSPVVRATPLPRCRGPPPLPRIEQTIFTLRSMVHLLAQKVLGASCGYLHDDFRPTLDRSACHVRGLERHKAHAA